MEGIISLIVPAEMLIINLFVIDRYSERKYSASITYTILALFSAVLFFFAYIYLSKIEGYGNGNGLFILLGCLLLIPLKVMYKNTTAKIICVACTSWIYTFIVFSFSIHICGVFPQLNRIYFAVTIQTVIYVVTIFSYDRLLKTKYIDMLSQLSGKETIYLMWISIGWFWSAFILNLSFVYIEVYAIRVITIISIAFCAFSTYRYIYQVIIKDRTIQKLKHLAYHDDLTNLPGRLLFEKDAIKLMKEKKVFHMMFLDLNKFKSINDNYGHDIGDEYLEFVSQYLQYRVGVNGKIYRIGGDEFICIYRDRRISAFINIVESFPQKLPEKNIPFLGISYGSAKFPDDGNDINDLIKIADKKMYEMKKKHYSKIPDRLSTDA